MVAHAAGLPQGQQTDRRSGCGGRRPPTRWNGAMVTTRATSVPRLPSGPSPGSASRSTDTLPPVEGADVDGPEVDRRHRREDPAVEDHGEGGRRQRQLDAREPGRRQGIPGAPRRPRSGRRPAGPHGLPPPPRWAMVTAPTPAKLIWQQAHLTGPTRPAARATGRSGRGRRPWPAGVVSASGSPTARVMPTARIPPATAHTGPPTTRSGHDESGDGPAPVQPGRRQGDEHDEQDRRRDGGPQPGDEREGQLADDGE